MSSTEKHNEKSAVHDDDIMEKTESLEDTIAPMTEKEGKSILWKIDLK